MRKLGVVNRTQVAIACAGLHNVGGPPDGQRQEHDGAR
jgi:hypothetical protein